MFMKERHKRKEIFSFILVSNMDNRSRQFSISAFTLRVVVGILILLGIGMGVIIYLFSTRSYREGQLKTQIRSGEMDIITLEQEIATHIEEKENLKAENQKLQQEIEALQKKEEEEKTPKTAYPKYYPLENAGELISTFSEAEPYLSINVQKGNHVIATGDGVVRLVDYHDGYVHSIEIEHIEGYISRYLCDKNAEILVAEGDTVKQRDYLLTIASNNTELHYQIIFNDETLNPFQMMGEEEQ